jgi:predicted transporter
VLIVGSAVGLVISLRATLRDTIPYFPALIFMLITLAIYGAGMYTLRRWNLQATSRGVLIIALLLSPLNFVAAIVLSGPISGR